MSKPLVLFNFELAGATQLNLWNCVTRMTSSCWFYLAYGTRVNVGCDASMKRNDETWDLYLTTPTMRWPDGYLRSITFLFPPHAIGKDDGLGN